jgi:hypothetical protein
LQPRSSAENASESMRLASRKNCALLLPHASPKHSSSVKNLVMSASHLPSTMFLHRQGGTGGRQLNGKGVHMYLRNSKHVNGCGQEQGFLVSSCQGGAGTQLRFGSTADCKQQYRPDTGRAGQHCVPHLASLYSGALCAKLFCSALFKA